MALWIHARNPSNKFKYLLHGSNLIKINKSSFTKLRDLSEEVNPLEASLFGSVGKLLYVAMFFSNVWSASEQFCNLRMIFGGPSLQDFRSMLLCAEIPFKPRKNHTKQESEKPGFLIALEKKWSICERPQNLVSNQ